MTNKELILANLMRAMIKYDGGDAPLIQHFVKVHDFARMIAIAEGMTGEDLFVLEAAAILHDVGIHVSQARYGNCDGKHQEGLGPDEARKVLSEVDGFTAAQIERICWLTLPIIILIKMLPASTTAFCSKQISWSIPSKTILLLKASSLSAIMYSARNQLSEC